MWKKKLEKSCGGITKRHNRRNQNYQIKRAVIICKKQNEETVVQTLYAKELDGTIWLVNDDTI